MTTLTPRILRGLDRFHAAHPWDHNAHYHRWILRQLPRRFNSALDVGSGSGDLAKLLASRAEAVHGIDIDSSRASAWPSRKIEESIHDATCRRS